MRRSSGAGSTGRKTGWLSWLIGGAIFGAVVSATLRIGDAQELLRLLHRVEPGWVLLAALIQATTYISESQVWRAAARAGGSAVPLSTAYQLSIAKLFVDQSVPSGGLSGTLLYVEGLRRSGTPKSVAISALIVDAFSYYCAYALCVAAALVLAVTQKNINATVAAIAVAFVIVSTAFAVGVLLQLGRPTGTLRRALGRYRLMRKALNLVRDVDPALAHNPRLLARAIGWQISIQLLDTATVWVLLLAFGSRVEPGMVFTSYMFSALFRTLSFTPGGLGTFEAASVVILRTAGVPLETAFAATVLFRGLNFWVPMIPGLWCARRVMRFRGPFSQRRSTPSGAFARTTD
jgi:Mg2+-importing ATPase